MSFLKRFICLFSPVLLTQNPDSGATVPIIPALEDSLRRKQLSNRDQSPGSILPHSDIPAKSRSLDASADPTLRERRHKERKTAKRIQERSNGEHRILSAEWMTQWRAFLRGGMLPGPVKIAGLRGKNGELKKGKVLGVDYVLVVKELADYLVSVYGGDKALDPNFIQDCPTPRAPPPVLPSELRPKEPKIAPVCDDSEVEMSQEEGSLNKSSTLASTPLVRKPTDDSSIEVSLKVDKGLVGLENKDFQCYLNSALQCLVSLKPVKDWAVLETDPKRRFCYAVGTLTRVIYEAEPMSVLSPQPLLDLIQHRFSPSKMHDSVEFLVYLLDHIDRELRSKHRVKSLGDAWVLYQALHSRFLTEVFTGVMRSDVTCGACAHVSSTLDPFTQLDLAMAKSVTSALEEFIQREPLSPAFVCPGCGRAQGSTRKISLQRCPSTLILTLKRFQSHPHSEKLNQFISFHKKLDLGRYSEGPNHIYQLQAVLVHSGDIEAGHYVAYCKRGHSWYLFNDALVQSVKLKEVLMQQAYVLFYSLQT